jgi:hypothetical protein
MSYLEGLIETQEVMEVCEISKIKLAYLRRGGELRIMDASRETGLGALHLIYHLIVVNRCELAMLSYMHGARATSP